MYKTTKNQQKELHKNKIYSYKLQKTQINYINPTSGDYYDWLIPKK